MDYEWKAVPQTVKFLGRINDVVRKSYEVEFPILGSSHSD
jgi:hypothetical protein